MISERWCLCILVGAKMCLSTCPRMTQETHSDSLSLGLVQVLISWGDVNVIRSTPHMTTAIQVTTVEAGKQASTYWEKKLKTKRKDKSSPVA